MKSDDVFQQEVKQILQPKLFSLGFERIKIKDHWFYPTFLFEHNDIWFGSSWDWRDNYLEVDLGRLFFFEDVLPSVIIIGTINICETLTGGSIQFEGYEKYFQGIFHKVVEELDEKVRLFDVQYTEAIEQKIRINENSSKKQKQYHRIFLSHLGRQLKRDDIPCN